MSQGLFWLALIGIIFCLQGKKYVKRSELEREVRNEEEEEEGRVEGSGRQTTSSLLSPTSVTSPVEDSPIFSIPKAEVCVCVCVLVSFLAYMEGKKYGEQCIPLLASFPHSLG